MDISTASWAGIDEKSIVVVTSSNEKIIFPENTDNRHRKELQVWLDQGNTIDPYEPPVKLPRRVGEFREFMALFTPQEQVALKEAERDNVQVAIWFDLARGGATLSLDHATVAPGFQFMVDLGLLTEARRTEILATDFDAV